MQGGVSFLEKQSKQDREGSEVRKWDPQGHPSLLKWFPVGDTAVGDPALLATHSVLGIEVCLTGNEVLCTVVVAGPHSHMQCCAEQLEN
jgi:hypothetical protein